jgi:hypothetical protein
MGLTQPMQYAVGFAILYVIVAIIFVAATVAYSALIGSLDFGAFWPFVGKAALLVGIAAAVMLLPYGGWIVLVVWWVGVVLVFRVDFWQARILVVIIWALSFLVRLALFLTLYSSTRS